ncbi:intercellular adhesion molecule 5-like isoform X2 [Montipora foliosa]|uniref:intercellular adhesion molecule 5-like isoform X2 n=1 Tax=Montipora foliosa TaxID=591990 RepID=UPI0035F166CF
MSLASSSVFLQLVAFLRFVLTETATTQFIVKPQSPSFVVEGQNFTLRYSYTLNGGLGLVQFFKGTGPDADVIGKTFVAGDIPVEQNFQARYKAFATSTYAEMTIVGVQRSDQGTFQLAVAPTGSGSLSHYVKLVVHIPANISDISGNQTVPEGTGLQLNCSATGEPGPNITWTRLSDNSSVTMPMMNISRQDAGGYRCTAYNGIGSPSSKDVYIDVQFPANISDISGNQTVPEGTGLQLSRSATGEPGPNITWTRLSDNSSVTMPMMNISRQDAGGYRCTAYNGIGSPSSKDVYIDVQFPANISDISGNQTVPEGTGLQLSCSATGEPGPNITWTRLSDNSSVTMPMMNISRQDAGGYRCTAYNGIGSPSSKDVYIDVQFPANISDISGNQTVLEGTGLQLNCSATGEPGPNITWTRLSDNSSFTMPMMNISRQDAGGYRCTAYNGIGSPSSKDVYIDVQFPANISDISGNQTVLEGTGLQLNCSATGEPGPNITWTRLSDNSSFTMPMMNISRQDAGGYRCTAYNGIGSPSSKDVYIDVQYPPAPAAVEAHTLTCQVDGNPAPMISWYDGSKASGTVIANGKQLKVTKSGCYTCSARNSLGPSLNHTYCVTSMKPSTETPTPTELAMPVKPPTRTPTPAETSNVGNLTVPPESSNDTAVNSTAPQPLKQQVALCGLLCAVVGLLVHV